MTPINPRFTKPTFTSSRPNDHVLPRAHTDPEHRRKHYGQVRSMEYDDDDISPWAWLGWLVVGVIGAGALFGLLDLADYVRNLWFTVQ